MSYLGQEPGQGQAEYFVFTASGSETSVTTADDGRPVSYTVGQVSVYLNGVKLIEGSGKDFVATNGSTIASLAALTASDVVEVVALSAFSPSDTVSASSGGTFSSAVTFGAGLTSTTGTFSGALQSTVSTGVGGTNIKQGKLEDTSGQGLEISSSDGTVTIKDKLKQEQAFMQHSTHQAMVLGG